jgi:hypothetical protein
MSSHQLAPPRASHRPAVSLGGKDEDPRQLTRTRVGGSVCEPPTSAQEAAYLARAHANSVGQYRQHRTTLTCTHTNMHITNEHIRVRSGGQNRHRIERARSTGAGRYSEPIRHDRASTIERTCCSVHPCHHHRYSLADRCVGDLLTCEPSIVPLRSVPPPCACSLALCLSSCTLRAPAVESAGGDTISPLDSLPVRAVEYPPGFSGKSRRGSVSAESDRMPASSFVLRTIHKPVEAYERIRKATAKSILFSGLDESQRQEIAESMEEVKVKAGEIVITQFQEGTNHSTHEHTPARAETHDRACAVAEVARQGAPENGCTRIQHRHHSCAPRRFVELGHHPLIRIYFALRLPPLLACASSSSSR